MTASLAGDGRRGGSGYEWPMHLIFAPAGVPIVLTVSTGTSAIRLIPMLACRLRVMYPVKRKCPAVTARVPPRQPSSRVDEGGLERGNPKIQTSTSCKGGVEKGDVRATNPAARTSPYDIPHAEAITTREASMALVLVCIQGY